MPTSQETQPLTRPTDPEPLVPVPGPHGFDWQNFDPTSIADINDLSIELITYQTHLTELLKNQGEYVLIKGRAIVAYFPTLEAALECAAEHFGTEPALIKQVVEFEPVHPASGVAV